jgi:hypothetical protein
MGDGSDLSFPYSQVPEYVVAPDDNRLITFTTTTGKTLRGEAHLTFDGSSLSILSGATTKISFDNSGNISASANMSASYFYGDGRYLTGITASGGGGSASAKGPIGSLQFQSGSGTISGSSALLFLTGSGVLVLTGGLSASVNISASAFYGDGSNLTGITASATAVADGPIGSLQFRENVGGEVSGSAAILYDFSTDRLTLRSGLVLARTAVTTHHTAATNEYFLGVRTSSVEILFDATQCYNGQVFVIKDEIGSASLGTPITLRPSASQTIDNGTTASINSPFGAANLYTDGTNWFVY